MSIESGGRGTTGRCRRSARPVAAAAATSWAIVFLVCLPHLLQPDGRRRRLGPVVECQVYPTVGATMMRYNNFTKLLADHQDRRQTIAPPLPPRPTVSIFPSGIYEPSLQSGQELADSNPHQQAISDQQQQFIQDQQRQYLAYLVQQQQQQQQQKLQQQQQQNFRHQQLMSPHASFYSLDSGENAQPPPPPPPQPAQQPQTGEAHEQARPIGPQQAAQRAAAGSARGHNADLRRQRAPMLTASVQLPNRAHHYTPPPSAQPLLVPYRSSDLTTQVSGGVEGAEPQQPGGQRVFSFSPISSGPPAGRAAPAAAAAAAVNLSRLLRPGEVVLSAREVRRQRAGAPVLVRNSTSVLGVRDIESLLERLGPLGLAERDKATNLHQVAGNSLDQQEEDEAEEDHGQDESERDRQQEREDEREMLDSEGQAAARVHDFLADHVRGGQGASGSRALTGSGRKLAPGREREQSSDDSRQQVVGLLRGLGDRRLAAASRDYERFYKPPGETRARSRREPPNLPIELLVDHLMAGSRLATRADHNHQDEEPNPSTAQNPVDDPENQREYGQLDYGQVSDDDDDDDDEDDPLAQGEEEDGAGPEEEEAERDYEDSPGGLLEPEESARNETRVSAPLSAFNSTTTSPGDSWVPLGAGVAPVRGGVATPSEPGPSRNATRGRSGRHRRRRRRQRRRRSRGSSRAARAGSMTTSATDEFMKVGNKSLSRVELVRLVRALNKMASSKRPSAERDASRRLLRHLIKLALANFKREQRGHAEQRVEDTNRRLRESLRSMLAEPNLTAAASPHTTSSGANSSSGAKISIRLQPWRLNSSSIDDEREDLVREPPREPSDQEEDQEDGDPRLRGKKSLVQISDDLERYFDTDFFEDLADKTQPLKAGAGVAATNQSLAGNQTAAATNLRTPAVIYGRRDLEAADEEDVDLDHVRVRAARPLGGENDSGAERKPPPRRKRRGRRRRARGRKRPGRTRNNLQANEPDDEEPDDEERRQAESKPRRVRARGGRRRRRKRKRVDRDKEEERQQQQEPEEGQQVAPGGDREDERDQGDQAGESQQKEDSGGEQLEGDGEGEKSERDGDGESTDERPQRRARDRARLNKKKERKKKRERQKSSNSRSKKWNPSRDEVPAPIVAAKMSRESVVGDNDNKNLKSNKGKVASENSVRARLLPVGGVGKKAKPDKPAKGAKSTTNLKTKQKQDQPRENKKSPQASPKRLAPVKTTRRPENIDEENYSSEGEEICEDGKCRTVMKSSDPKMMKSIIKSHHSGIKRDLDQTINKWLRKDEEAESQAKSSGVKSA